MKALGQASNQYPVVQVLGYRAPGDNGGGLFVWDPSSTSTTNICTIFQSTGVSTGRWKRQMEGKNLNVEMCGAYSDATHPTETLAAFQAANDLVAASSTPNAVIEFKGAEYSFGSLGGVVKAASFSCPNWVGGGGNSSRISMAPLTETAAFTFLGGSGSYCKGGAKEFNVSGNSNTIGCSFVGQGGGHCDVTFVRGKMAVLFWNSSPGLFTEYNVVNPIIENMSQVNYVAEYRVSGGGNASFHGSGFGPNTAIASSNHFNSDPLIRIGTDSFVYNSPLNVKWFNSGGGTQTLIENFSSNVATFVNGSIEIETLSSDPAVLAASGGNQVIYGGNFYTFGADIGSGLDPGRMIFAKTKNSNSLGQITLHNTDALYITSTFTGTSGITLTGSPIKQNYTSYQVTILGVNGDNSYNWSGTVLVNTDITGPGTCANPTVVGGKLYTDTNTWGVPTVTCSSNVPSFSNSNWTSGQFSITYSVHGQ